MDLPIENLGVAGRTGDADNPQQAYFRAHVGDPRVDQYDVFPRAEWSHYRKMEFMVHKDEEEIPVQDHQRSLNAMVAADNQMKEVGGFSRAPGFAISMGRYSFWQRRFPGDSRSEIRNALVPSRRALARKRVRKCSGTNNFLAETRCSFLEKLPL